MRLCLTGIEDINRRTDLHKLLVRNGGAFAKDLELNSSANVTHLLCGAERGEEVDAKGWTRKMQVAEKANRRGLGTIRMVWEEWFWDCLEFRGAWLRYTSY